MGIAKFWIPYSRVTIRASSERDAAVCAVAGLLDRPSPQDQPYSAYAETGYRLRGTVHENRMRLIVRSRPWRRIGYLPVVKGEFVATGSGLLLTLRFRPPIYDMVFLPAWAVYVMAIGGPWWFALGPVLLLHLVSCLIGFWPEVDRVTGLLRTALTDAASTEDCRTSAGT